MHEPMNIQKKLSTYFTELDFLRVEVCDGLSGSQR